MSLKSGNSKKKELHAFFTSFRSLEIHNIYVKKIYFGQNCDENCQKMPKNVKMPKIVKKMPFFADVITKMSGSGHFQIIFLSKIKSIGGWTSMPIFIDCTYNKEETRVG